MGGCVNVVPGISGDDPSLGRFVFQRIDPFGLARQNAGNATPFKQSAKFSLTHEFGKVGPEGNVENGVGLALRQSLGGRAGVNLEQRGPLFADPFDIGAFFGQQFLEGRHRRFSVFIIGRHGGPALGRKLGRLLRQHGRLHVGSGAQAEGVTVALGPGDGVAQGFGGDEKHLVPAGEIGDRQTDVGEEGAGQQHHLLAAHQLLGEAHGVAGLAPVVARDHLERPAENAALGVDLVQRQLPAVAIRHGEGGQRPGVAVELADPDRLGGEPASGDKGRGERHGRGKNTPRVRHVGSPFHSRETASVPSPSAIGTLNPRSR